MQSVTASKIIVIHIENSLFDELHHLITWIQGGQIKRSGGSPSDRPEGIPDTGAGVTHESTLPL